MVIIPEKAAGKVKQEHKRKERREKESKYAAMSQSSSLAISLP